jgi:hypothetical protein
VEARTRTMAEDDDDELLQMVRYAFDTSPAREPPETPPRPCAPRTRRLGLVVSSESP